MTVQPSFIRYLRMARETTWGASPAGVGIEFNATGGAYSFITTSPLGTLKPIEVKHRTQGATGKRSVDQHAPFGGFQRSEGTLDIPFVPTYAGLLLRTALGADAAIDTTDAEIKASTALTTSPQTINSGFVQPTTNKYPYCALVFTLTGGATFGATGNVVITGTDSNDAVITETVTFGAQAAGFTVYSQLNYKTVTSFVITGVVLGGGSGTITINGINYTTHTITCTDTSGSIIVEEYAHPGAGTGNSFVFNGLTQTQLNLSFSTLEEEGILMLQPNFLGKFPAAVAKTTYALTPLRAWPAWTASVTKGGSAFSRVQSAQIQLTPGSRLFRSAVGSRSPQGKIDLARRTVITGQLYLEDSTEWDAFSNDTVGDYQFVFTSPFKITSTLFQSLTLDFDKLYFETMDAKEDDGMIVADFTAFTIEDASSNVYKATLVNTKNGVY